MSVISACAMALAGGVSTSPVGIASAGVGPELVGVPVEFVLFGLMILGLALLPRRTMAVATGGLAVLVAYKLVFTGFGGVWGLPGLAGHLEQQAVLLANFFLRIVGFAILSQHLAASRVPTFLLRTLPSGWIRGMILLVLVFVFSACVDSLAAAIFGASIAASLFRGRELHVGYLAAIVAASNAGGAGSMIGNAAARLMWIQGVPARELLWAYAASVPALVVFGLIASRWQARLQVVAPLSAVEVRIDWGRAAVVLVVLGLMMAATIAISLYFLDAANLFPWRGTVLWAGILVTAWWRRPLWYSFPGALRSAIVVVALLLGATMLPFVSHTAAGWTSALRLGFMSAVVMNAGMIQFALLQGGYDWTFVAYAVVFGGSLLWFGSAAGVMVANRFPQAKPVGAWVRYGWPVALAFLVGFASLLVLSRWRPGPPTRAPDVSLAASGSSP